MRLPERDCCTVRAADGSRWKLYIKYTTPKRPVVDMDAEAAIEGVEFRGHFWHVSGKFAETDGWYATDDRRSLVRADSFVKLLARIATVYPEHAN